MKPVALLLAVMALTSACSSTPEPRPLSTDEAERLALVRFANFTAKNTAFTASIPSPGGTLRLTGRVDFVRHIGYAVLRTDGRADTSSSGLLQWNLSRLAFLAGNAPELVDPPPAGNWQLRMFQRSGAELDAALRLLVNLAADRPDNAQLLQQSSARWLRQDTIGDLTVDVFEGPQQPGRAPSADGGRVYYWVDTTSHLKRLQARLGNATDFADFTFPGTAPAITPIPPITPQ